MDTNTSTEPEILTPARHGLSRRHVLSGASLAALGLASRLGWAKEPAPATPGAEASPAAGSNTLEDFIYDLEHGTGGWHGPGGTALEATVEEFPLSQSIAGVSMRLNPGAFRELRWHSIAAEGAYVLEGRVRTTVISPDGTTATDDFAVGDIWYFPKGHGHSSSASDTSLAISCSLSTAGVSPSSGRFRSPTGFRTRVRKSLPAISASPSPPSAACPGRNCISAPGRSRAPLNRRTSTRASSKPKTRTSSAFSMPIRKTSPAAACRWFHKRNSPSMPRSLPH